MLSEANAGGSRAGVMKIWPVSAKKWPMKISEAWRNRQPESWRLWLYQLIQIG